MPASGDPELIRCGPGCHYLEACQSSGCFTPANLDQVRQGLEQVLGGERASFSLEYLGQGTGESGWRHLHIVKIRGNGGGAAISQRDISFWKAARQ